MMGEATANQTIAFLLRALKHRNYRLFFGGQGMSLMGTWMQQIAMSWLVYRLSGSAFVLGLVGFLNQVPVFFLAPVAGVISDRFNRHRLLIILQVLAMVQASILAFLTLTAMVAVWHIFVLAVIMGCINGFEMPTRQSFVVDMLEQRDDLANAIALNSFMFNSARLVGPSIAGLVISVAGEGICFLLNTVSFIAVIIALAAMKITKKERGNEKMSLVGDLKEGFSYAYRFAPIKYILILVCVLSVAGMPYLVLLPVFAKDILHGDSTTLGFLVGASGTGGLTGALYIASRQNVVGSNKRLGIGMLVFGASLICFALSPNVILSLISMFVTGFYMILVLASSNMMLQTISQEDKRGRIISLYILALIGAAPFGSLVAGSVAHAIGSSVTVASGGIICILIAVLFYRRLPMIRKQVQPVYRQLGLVGDIPFKISD